MTQIFTSYFVCSFIKLGKGLDLITSYDCYYGMFLFCFHVSIGPGRKFWSNVQLLLFVSGNDHFSEKSDFFSKWWGLNPRPVHY
jgi:hypothetical protein